MQGKLLAKANFWHTSVLELELLDPFVLPEYKELLDPFVLPEYKRILVFYIQRIIAASGIIPYIFGAN
jgi:hypothetical protein